ncbi:MAG: hypothetical protein GY772_30755 [bacterium]|nr:hypothetical protein [bacterium]
MKACAHRQNLRKRRARRDAEVSRGADWKRSVQYIGQRLSGQNKRAHRELLKEGLKIVAALAQSAYKAMSKENQRRYLGALDEHAHTRKMIAKDPAFVPDLDMTKLHHGDKDIVKEHEETPLFRLDFQSGDWMSQRLEGLDSYYLCRNPNCLCFCPPICWVEEALPVPPCA